MGRNFLVVLILLIIANFNFVNAQPLIEDPSLEGDENLIVESTENSNTDSVYYQNEKIYVKAPNFYAQKDTGQWVSLNASEGHVVILNFWASYDRYCLKLLSPLQKLQNKYKKKGLQVLIVSVDDPVILKEFLNKGTNYNFPFLFGSKELAKEYNVWGLPTTYILDKKLGIRKVFNGYTNVKNLEKEIRKLL